MSLKGPIIVIEDDEDDREFYGESLKTLEVENEIIFFTHAEKAFKYLEITTEKPMLILSDINLPGMSGIELKRRIQDNPFLRSKSIPFIFLTTSSDKNSVVKAYEMMVQGYFVKPNSVPELIILFARIIEYWKICKHPNTN